MPIKNLVTSEVSYEGCVIWTGDAYMGCDRYRDYARVWSGVAVIEVDIGVGYCDQTMRTHSAVIDATPEVLAAVELYERQRTREIDEALTLRYKENELKKRAEIEALQKKCDNAPEIGSVVIITTGRLKKTKNINKGDEGVVYWKGVNRFDSSKISIAIVLKDGRKVYVDSKNVELDFVGFINRA